MARISGPSIWSTFYFLVLAMLIGSLPMNASMSSSSWLLTYVWLWGTLLSSVISIRVTYWSSPSHLSRFLVSLSRTVSSRICKSRLIVFGCNFMFRMSSFRSIRVTFWSSHLSRFLFSLSRTVSSRICKSRLIVFGCNFMFRMSYFRSIMKTLDFLEGMSSWWVC